MSLVISADGQKLAAQKGTPFWTTTTEFSVAVWVKITTAQWGNLFGICDFANPSYNNAPLRTAAGTTYDHGLRLQGGDYRMDSSGLVTGGWDLIVITYKKDGSRISYRNGSVALTASTGTSAYWSGGVGFDYVCFGVMPYDASNSRSKVAHGAVWNKELTAAEVASLYNGGTAGAGKNPTAVQNANLVFYAPLTSDATVSVGGVTLTATGSPTYDGADNPNVDAAGGGSTVTHSATGALTASAATISGTASRTGAAVTHSASGSLVASAATVSGTASRTGAAVTHSASGALVAGSATISGVASHVASGSFVSDIMVNNTGTVQSSVSITWEWNKGVIGSAKASSVYGTGVTNSGGTYTATGLPSGDGFLLVGTPDGSVYYHPGTVT